MTQIIEIDYAHIMMVLPGRLSRSEFITASRAPVGTYAHEIAQRIHACLYDYSMNLKQDYERYFASDYPSFESFLYWRYHLLSEKAEEISDLENDGYFIGFGRDTFGIREDMGFESMINAVFEIALGATNED